MNGKAKPESPAGPGSLNSQSSPSTVRTARLTEPNPEGEQSHNQKSTTQSTTRVLEQTLLSAPAPADRSELDIDQRIRRLEQELDHVAFRVRTLERLHQARKSELSPGFWLVVLIIVLALGYLLFESLRG